MFALLWMSCSLSSRDWDLGHNTTKFNSITSLALSPLRVIKIITWVCYNGFYETDNMLVNQHVYHRPFMIFFFSPLKSEGQNLS